MSLSLLASALERALHLSVCLSDWKSVRGIQPFRHSQPTACAVGCYHCKKGTSSEHRVTDSNVHLKAHTEEQDTVRKLQVFHTVYPLSIMIRVTNRCPLSFVIFLYLHVSSLHVSGLLPAHHQGYPQLLLICYHLVHVVFFFSLHVLLNQMAAIVVYIFRLVFLYSYALFACLTLMNFRFFIPCIL